MSAASSLGPDDALRAVRSACAPYSAYIADELRRLHARRVADGRTGYPPTASRVLRWLRSLEREKLVEASSVPDGYYGYKWCPTAAGEARLVELSEARS